jgi:hypothetical protein
MKYRLTVSGTDGARRIDTDGWTSFVVLASLSAEPESLAELAEAVRRYLPEHQLFDGPPPPLGEPEVDGKWCLIDLTGRTVVAGHDFDLPDPHGAYEADEEDHAQGFSIVWLDTPRDWLFRSAGDDWREVVALRAASRASTPRIDARPVLFGRPLLEHLADGVLAAPNQGEEGRRDRTRAIHARWLMTPRDDLGGRTPREILLADRSRIGMDREHRAEQWSRQGHAPPALAKESPAYRLGGFGTTEVVLYFDLVRNLLGSAWALPDRTPGADREDLIEQMAGCRDEWLNAPHEELPLTPAELIDLERQRMPVASDGSHLHDDCPLCQAEAEGHLDLGPAFMWFDGHHLELEDEFAFSLCATHEEWEREQEDYRRYSEEMDRKREADATGDNADPFGGSVWRHSFVNWDAPDGLNTSRRDGLFLLGFLLSELTGDLKGQPDGEELQRSLNVAYQALRTSPEEVGLEAADEFRNVLEAISAGFPALTPKCADLQGRLDEILRRS